VYPERIDFSSVQQIRFADAPSRARRVIKRGDILVSTVRPNLQGFAEFQPPDDGPYVCSTGFAVLRPKNGHDQQFFLHQLLSDFGASQFHAYVTGTNYPAISDRDFARLKLLVPPNDLERELASDLKTISTAIAAARETIVASERLKKGLMQQLLTGRLKPDGKPRPNSEWSDHPRIGKFPSTWRVGPAKEFFVLQRGFDLPDAEAKPGLIPVVKSNGIENYHNVSQVTPPGVVTGRSGTIGKVFYVEQPFWPHNTTLYVKDFRGNDPLFVYFLLQDLHVERQLAGTTIPTLNRNDIHRLWITAPSSTAEQRGIATALHNCESLVLAKQQKIAALQRLKKSLMQNLLTGRIQMPVVVQDAAR
jgi:type I restriction enzyme S subunit